MRRGIAAALVLVLVGLVASPLSVHAQAIDWGYSPEEYRGRIGERFTYTCSPNGNLGTVWGTDVYTDDSSLCTAAVHAGLISVTGGGTVIIQMLPGQSSYAASTRNGVTTEDWGAWDGSFRFVP